MMIHSLNYVWQIQSVWSLKPSVCMSDLAHDIKMHAALP